MTQATIHEAKTHLSRLIRKALDGEEVIIAKRHKPLVRLEAVAEKLPASLRTALDYLILVAIAILLGVLGWKGWQLGARTSFSAATLPLTWAWLYAAAPAFSSESSSEG